MRGVLGLVTAMVITLGMAMPDDPVLVALLANGTLTTLSATGQRKVIDCGVRRVDRAPGPGTLIAVDPSSGLVYALYGKPKSNVLIADIATAKCGTVSLEKPGLQFSALVRAPVSGDIYLFATGDSGSAWVVMNPRTSAFGPPFFIRRNKRAPGEVFDAAFSPDESGLVVSYHGGPDGADWIETPGRVPKVCKPVADRSSCLLHAHGTVRPYGRDSVLVATGSEELQLLSVKTGEGRTIKTGLARNHLMEFRVAHDGKLFALGPCGYTGGYSQSTVISMQPMQIVVPSRPGQRLCGSNMVALKSVGNAAAVVRTDGPFGEGSTVILFDEINADVWRRIIMTWPVLDLAALR